MTAQPPIHIFFLLTFNIQKPFNLTEMLQNVQSQAEKERAPNNREHVLLQYLYHLNV